MPSIKTNIINRLKNKRLFSSSPFFKIPSFMFDLRVITAKCVMLRCIVKNKSVHSCRFVHHVKFHCIMTTLNKLFKIKFEGGGGTGKEPNKHKLLSRKFFVSPLNDSCVSISLTVLRLLCLIITWIHGCFRMKFGDEDL